MALPDQLPDGWFNFSPQDKVDFFNEQGVTPQDLMSVGVSQSDIAWMQQNLGYDPNQAAANDVNNAAQASAQAAILEQIADQAAAEEDARQEAARQEAARQEVARQEAARQEAARQEAILQEQIRAQQLAAQQEAARQEAARIAAEQQAAINKAASVGVNLPSNWFDIGAQDKVNWLVDNKVTESQLRAYGTSQAEIDAIKPYGYYDVPAKLAADQEAARVAEAARQEAARQEAARVEAARVAAERTAAENEVKSLYQEVLGRQPTAAELNQYVSQFGTSIDATEKNIFSEDVSTEVLKNKLLAGNPDGDELTRRVVIESVNNKWTPEQTLSFVNTQFGVNKTMADYERAVSNFFAPAVSNLLANGATESQIRQLGADQGIIPSVIDAAVKNNIGAIAQNDLANNVKDFFTTEKRTEDGVEKTYITPDFDKLIDYATKNKLSYADVATAFSIGRPEFKSVNITKDLVYENDRQQFNTLLKPVVDPATNKTVQTVSYGDALKEAITKGIGLENLAKFFGQTPDQFKTTISSNLGFFADALRTSGVNAEAGLSDLLGIQPKDTTSALKTLDTDKAITGSLKQKEAGGLTYNEILDEIEASGMTIDDFVTRYFGQDKADLLTGLKSESKFTPEQRDLRDDYNAFTSTFNKDNPLTYSKISDYLASKNLTDAQASSLFGIPAKDLADYRTDTKITGQLNAEKQDDNRLSLNEILDVISGSGMDIKSFVEKYFGKDQTDLITSLTKEKEYTPEQRNIRDDYNVFTSTFNKDNPLTYSKISDYLASKQLTDAEASSLFGIPANELAGYRTDTKITGQLNQEKADDGKLSLSEILDVIDSSGMPIDDFVKRYFGTDQAALATSLTNEKKFTPEQRAIRDTYNDFVTGLGDNKPTVADVAKFVDINKLTDAQAETLLGVPAKDLGTYRRDTFITSGLNELKKSDNRLDYTEIVTFAKDNNIPFNEVAKYLATPENQESLVKTLEETKTADDINNLLQTATTEIKYNDPRYTKLVQDSEGNSSYVWNEAGQQLQREKQEAGKQLEALGYEFFDPDGEGDQPAKFYSPQEAASITGTKVNNQLRQEALAKTVSETPGLTPLAKQLGMALDPDSTGGKLKNLPSFLEEVANRFTSKTGITDLNDLAERKLNITVYPANEAMGEMYFNNDTGQFEKYPTQFYNKKTGQVIPYEAVQGLGTFGNQQDETGVSFTQNPDGTFGVKARYAYEGEAWKDVVTALAPIALNFVPGVGQFLGEVIGTSVGGIELAMLGGEAIAGTGLTGSFMSAGLSPTAAEYAAKLVVNGVYKGAEAEATGGDFKNGFISGGVAPVFGQITTNAVNSLLTEFNLPEGVGKAAGNSVMQLITTGKIDPTQVITAGVSPTLSKAIQDETGLNDAQTKLVLNTIVTEGKNLQALLDPTTAMKFVSQNQGLFNNLVLDAASGVTNIQTGQAVDLGAFNEDQVKQLQGQDTVATIGTDTLPGTGIDTVIGAGQDTVSPVVLDTIPGVTGLDTSPSITTPNVIDEFQGYDSAIKAAQAIASGATQFEGVEAVQRFLEARAAGALDYQGYDMAKLEATLIGSQKTYANALAAAKELYGPNATFNYGGELFSTKTGLPVGATGVEVPGSTEVPTARLPNGMYSHQGFLAAGGGKDPEDYRSYVIAANELINKTGTANNLNPSGYNIAAARASDMSTRAGVVANAFKSPSGEVYRAPSSSYTAGDNSVLAGFGHTATSLGSTFATLAEGLSRGIGQTELADTLKQASVDARTAANSILNTSPDAAMTAGVSSGIKSGLSLLLSGGTPWAAALGPTVDAMNETFRDGQDRGLSYQDNATRTLLTGVAEYTGEYLGDKFGLLPAAKSLGKYFSELPLNPTASQIKDAAVAWGKANAIEQGSEIVTTVLNLANDQIHGITSSTPQTIDQLSTLIADQLKTVFIATNTTLGLGSGAFAASNAWSRGEITIDEATRLAANSPILSPQTGEQIVISSDPTNNLAIVQTPGGATVVDTTTIGPVQIGDAVDLSSTGVGLPEIINIDQPSVTAPTGTVPVSSDQTNIGSTLPVDQGQSLVGPTITDTGIVSTLPTGQIPVDSSAGVASTLPVGNQPTITAPLSGATVQAPIVDTTVTNAAQGTIDTAASLAAQQAASAASVASQNAQNASQAASSLAASGQVSPTVITASQTAAQTAAQAAQNATQNATVANNAAITGNTTVAQQASTAANQNAQVTNNIVTGNTNVVSDLPVNVVTPEQNFSDKTVTDLQPTIPETPVIPAAPSVPTGEFIFKPVEQSIINTILNPTTPATPTTPTKPVTPPKTPSNIPFIPFFPMFTSDGTTYVDYGQPDVPPPELYGIFNLPPPEYTRATGPMANIGIMSGATK